MSAAVAARSAFRSAAFRISSAAKPKSPPSSFRIPMQKPISTRILRSPVEMSSFCVESMLPYHTATASALLTSMLSAAPRCYGWTLEGINKSINMRGKAMHMGICNLRPMASYSTSTNADDVTPTEVVKELYDKMFKSVAQQRTMPPNAWLWSLIENCTNQGDIKLLFDLLTRLRIFRLSNLRIHADFNCNLCREITKACTRVGALDFGLKALWKHNVYGLSPTIGSAHHLLLYAKEHNDAKLMVEIMKLLKKNDLPLQPGTADIVFSICRNTNNWELLSKYGKRFTKGGVKLRQTSFDLWMAFAANRGDVDSLLKIEKLRSDSMKQHTLVTAFSCAKGFLLEHKPEEAAAVIQLVNQTLSDSKRPGVMVELQKLCSEWPFEVMKHQKEEDKKELASALQKDIPAMVNMLMNLGLAVKVNMDDLTKKEGILC